MQYSPGCGIYRSEILFLREPSWRPEFCFVLLQLEPFKGGWINVSKQLVNNTSPNQDQNKSQTEVALSGFPLLVFLHSLDCLKFLVKHPLLPFLLSSPTYFMEHVTMSQCHVWQFWHPLTWPKRKNWSANCQLASWGFRYFKIYTQDQTMKAPHL